VAVEDTVAGCGVERSGRDNAAAVVVVVVVVPPPTRETAAARWRRAVPRRVLFGI